MLLSGLGAPLGSQHPSAGSPPVDFRTSAWLGDNCVASVHPREFCAPLELEHSWETGTQCGWGHTVSALCAGAVAL